MKILFRVIILSAGILLVGCAVARTSYHVVTAPVRLFTGSSDEHPQTANTTTTTTVTNAPEAAPPEQPIPSPSPSPVRRRTQVAHTTGASAAPSPAAPRKRPEPNAGASASPSPIAEFPTAKPVPGKPGYVFDPFDPNGGYIDVSGYAPGSKVKDPTSKKIFIVP